MKLRKAIQSITDNQTILDTASKIKNGQSISQAVVAGTIDKYSGLMLAIFISDNWNKIYNPKSI
jgi:hypothetical protein